MIGWLLKFVTGGGLSGIADQITDWDIKRREAENDRERVQAETMIAQLQMRQEVLIAEQKHWATRWVRPALAFPAVVYWNKLVIWDTLLGWGSTAYPGDHVIWFVLLIPSAYFLTRPFEKARR